MRRRKMGAIYNKKKKKKITNSSAHQIPNAHPAANNSRNHGTVIEEIDGIVKVFRDGHIERLEIMPCVPPSLDSKYGVISQDVVIDKPRNVWARIYAPTTSSSTSSRRRSNSRSNLPLLVYFHGGGFCVGSASWRCYHEFMCHVAEEARCVVVSVNYRLAPENKLPAAYEDGYKAVMWLVGGGGNNNNYLWWSKYIKYDLSSNIFLAGDSAGANVAFNVALRLCSDKHIMIQNQNIVSIIKGIILIQPFFGGEARTDSEKRNSSSSSSLLSLAASDTYWRLALPAGSTRDHPWCNPLAAGSGTGRTLLLGSIICRTLVCISEMDILKDRNLEFCEALKAGGGANCKGKGGGGGVVVEQVVYEGVGHAFQVLDKSALAKMRTREMISHVKDFIHA